MTSVAGAVGADLIAQRVLPAYREVLQGPDADRALAALNRIRVLCAVRAGPQGVRRLNERIEQALAAEGLIRPDVEIYAGRPVILTANDHAQRLYNGDVGLIVADPDSGGALRVLLLATKARMCEAVSRPVVRSTGLYDVLWAPGEVGASG